MESSGGEAFLNAVVAEGAEFAFGIPGTHILPIIELLGEKDRLKFVNVRHEAGAAAMADAYGRLTGKPGLCLVTAGPGATNSLTGVAHAFSAASPMLHVSGTVPTGSGVGTFHGTDDPSFLERIFAPITKKSCTVRSVSEIPRTVHGCFQAASAGRRGPVHMSLPLNVLLAQGTPTAARHASKRPLTSSPNLMRAKRILSASQRPIVLVGEEARGMGRELEILSMKLQSPVMSTMNALGEFPQENPLFVGYVEQFWRISPPALDLLRDADLLVGAGVRFGSPETRCVGSLADTDWLFLTEEKTKRDLSKGLHLTGNVRSTLSSLANILPPATQSRKRWASKALGCVRSYLKEPSEIVSNGSGNKPIHPAYAIQNLIELLPSSGVVCSDSGSNEVWAREYLGVRKNCEYLYSGSFGGMGFALPAAIAASIVRPDTKVLAVSGDGGFLMSLMELSTLAEQESNVIMVVLNDSAYGMMWLLERRKVASLLNPVSFAEVAKGFGIRSWRVDEPGQLKDIYAEAFSVDGPAIVDVAVDYKQRFPYESILEEFRSRYPEN